MKFEEKLAESGLTLEDALSLDIYEVTRDELTDLGGFGQDQSAPHPGIAIPYHDIEGSPVIDSDYEFLRFRYLPGAPQTGAFGSLPKKIKNKYHQPYGSGTHPYLPKSIDWVKVKDDINTPILITEGEFKAACASKYGIPTIGLGGVYNFQSEKRGYSWLPELEDIGWKDRPVYIAWDSDAQDPSKFQLRQSMFRLAEVLYGLGSIAHSVELKPQDQEHDGVGTGQSKIGLDDFLVSFDEEDRVEQLQKLVDDAPLLTDRIEVFRLNEQYRYCRDGGTVVDMTRVFGDLLGSIHNLKVFESNEAPRKCIVRSMSTGDNPVQKKRKIPATKEWLESSHRPDITQICCVPGKDQMIEDVIQPGRYRLNIWPGWGCEPVEGDLTLWNELLDFLFKNTDETAREWFLNWLAYPIQNPGAKMHAYTLFHGPQGTGKTSIGQLMCRIYGGTSKQITQQHLLDGRNTWAIGRQFIQCDELYQTNRRSGAEKLKLLITQEEFTVDPKYKSTIDFVDTMNFLFTSNNPSPVMMENSDRRGFVVRVSDEGVMPPEWWERFVDWRDRGPGPSAVHYYLLNRDLGDWGPRSAAYVTDDKLSLIDSSKTELNRWVEALNTDSENVLAKQQGEKYSIDFATPTRLMLCYQDSDYVDSKVSANEMSAALVNGRVVKAHGGKPVRLSNGSLQRLYIVRNREKWIKSTHKEILEYMRGKENKLIY